MLKITAIGNITTDFALRTKENEELAYAIIRIASDRRYRDREGNKLTVSSPSRYGAPLRNCVGSI